MKLLVKRMNLAASRAAGEKNYRHPVIGGDPDGSLEQRLAELDDITEDDWTDELAAEAEQLEERHAELARTAGEETVYSDQDRAVAGCIVTIGDRGECRVYEGLVERATTRGEDGADIRDHGRPRPADRICHSEDEQASCPPITREQSVRKECGLSQVLVHELKATRHRKGHTPRPTGLPRHD